MEQGRLERQDKNIKQKLEVSQVVMNNNLLAIVGKVLFRAEALRVIRSTSKCVEFGNQHMLGATESRLYDAAFSLTS